jgi:hypothetical protein
MVDVTAAVLAADSVIGNVGLRGVIACTSHLAERSVRAWSRDAVIDNYGTDFSRAARNCVQPDFTFVSGFTRCVSIISILSCHRRSFRDTHRYR